ncbi:MAG UNVERIFIED_CONTAM: transglutaminase family protein [Planctomycetaceae bacterium]|jgi:transglutaminase-like putative cysteine protease
MRYKVTHRTTYSGSDPVSVGHNQAWLEFRQCERQQVESFSLQISPEPSVKTRRVDAFGNPVHMFSFSEGYQRLEVAAFTVVSVRADNTLATAAAAKTSVEQLLTHTPNQDPWLAEAREFAWPSPRVQWTHEIHQWAAQSFPAHRPLLTGLLDLTSRLHRDFTYDPQATTVNTPVQQAFQLKRGVCQDFAHLQIAMLRSLGLPARYISGYLRTIPPPGRQRLVGADASHAWLSVYVGDGQWLELDPTNNQMCLADHILLAWGRDYSDVPPVTGVFVGGAGHRLAVSVDVLPLD